MFRTMHFRHGGFSCLLWTVTFSIFAAVVSLSSASDAKQSFTLEEDAAETSPQIPKRVTMDIPPFSTDLTLNSKIDDSTNLEMEKDDIEGMSEDLRLITKSHIENHIDNELKGTSVFLKKIRLNADLTLLDDNKQTTSADPVHLRVTFGGTLAFKSVRTATRTLDSDLEAGDTEENTYTLRLQDVNEEITRALISSAFFGDSYSANEYIVAIRDSSSEPLSKVETISVRINLDINPIDPIEVSEERNEKDDVVIDDQDTSAKDDVMLDDQNTSAKDDVKTDDQNTPAKDDVKTDDQNTSAKGAVAAVVAIVSILAGCVVPFGILRYRKKNDERRRKDGNSSQRSDEDTLEIDPSDDGGNAAVDAERQWVDDIIDDPEMSMASSSQNPASKPSNQYISKLYSFIPQTPSDEGIQCSGANSTLQSDSTTSIQSKTAANSSRSTSSESSCRVHRTYPNGDENGKADKEILDGCLPPESTSPTRRKTRVSTVYDDLVVNDNPSSQGSKMVKNDAESDEYYSRDDLREILSQESSFNKAPLLHASSLERTLSRSLVTPAPRKRKRGTTRRQTSKSNSRSRSSGTMTSILEDENEEEDSIEMENGTAYDTEDGVESEGNKDSLADDVPADNTQRASI